MRIFNADESAFFFNPKGSYVVVGRGEKNVYSIVNSDKKQCITVLVNINAAGLVAPPMVIFKNLRLPNDVVASAPKEWGIGRSPETGWMTGEHFYEYVGNCFDEWLTKNNIQRPIIFFVDGHVSHLTMHLSELCSEKQIVLVALPPNATHLMQPCDIAVFRTLKAGWREERAKWRLENLQMESGQLKKVHFCGLLDKVIKERITPEVCRNAFRKAGLVPWNPDAVDYGKIPSYCNASTTLQTTEERDEDFARKLNKAIGSKLELFRKCHKECQPVGIEDTSLFELWKKFVAEEPSLAPESTVHSPLDSPLDVFDNQQESFFNYDGVDAQLLGEGNSTEPRSNSTFVAEESSLVPESTVHSPLDGGDDAQLLGEEIPQNRGPQLPVVEEGVRSDSKKTFPQNIGIPSPFKSALFWPEESAIKGKGKRKTAEKLPAVATSSKWQQLVKNKDSEKKRQIQLKEQRKEEREEKKRAREEMIKQKKCAKAKAPKAKIPRRSKNGGS